MIMKSKLYKYKVYRSMLMSFILLTAVIVVLICMTLFVLFSRSASKDVGEISESMLQQTSYAANILEDQVYEIGNNLISNRTMISTIYSDKLDYIQEYHTVNMLKNIEATYPFIAFIGLYNGYTDRYVNTKGITAQYERELLEQLKRSEEKSFGMMFPRKLESPGLGGERRLLTFVLQPGFNSYLPKKGLIIININADYIRQLIGNLKNKNSNYVITMDTNGVLLSSSREEQFMESAADKAYIDRILHANADSGSFVDRVDGLKSQISFVKSEQLNWYFVSVSPMKDLLFNLNGLKAFTLTIAFIIFGVGIFMSITLANYIHQPIRRLLHKITEPAIHSGAAGDNINELNMMDQSYASISKKVQEMESAVEVARKSNLFKYLNGSQSDLTNRYSKPLQGPYFNVIVMSIDAIREFKERHTEQTQSLIRFGICNIAQEWLSREEEANDIEIVIMNEQEIGILLQLKASNPPAELPLRIMEVQQTVSEYFKLTLTVGIGSVERLPEQIKHSYQIAREMAYHRFFHGSGQLFSDDGRNGRVPTELIYPEAQEKKLIESIQFNRMTDAAKSIDHFFSSLQGHSYHQALYVLQQLLAALNKSFNLMGSSVEEQRELFARMAFHTVSYETLEAFKSDLTQLCRMIGGQIEARAKNRNIEVVQAVKDYMDEYYWKPDISVEFLADYVNLTPGYLGKLFKTYYNQSVTDYLKDVRVEYSKRLLLESDAPVKQISEKVGIYNTTYFYTLFKKKYGMSPVQFRNDALLKR